MTKLIVRSVLSKDKAGTKFYQVSEVTVGNLALAWGSYGPAIALKSNADGDGYHPLADQKRVWFANDKWPFIATAGDAAAVAGAAHRMAEEIKGKKERSKSGYRFDHTASHTTEAITPSELLAFLRQRASLQPEAVEELMDAITGLAGVSDDADGSWIKVSEPEKPRENATKQTNALWGTW